MALDYVVYFYADREVVVVPESEIILGQYENFSLDDWRAVENEECVVNVLYNGLAYKACVLQVCLSSFLLFSLMIFCCLFFIFDLLCWYIVHRCGEVLTSLILQVTQAGSDVYDLVGKLRDFILMKKTSLRVLLGMVQRVAPQRRQKLPPLDVSCIYFSSR